MSSRQWRAPGATIPLLFIGTLEAQDVSVPVSGKDAWGLDTLERTIRMPAFLFADYCANLRQGMAYNGYYLQSWNPSPHPYAPSVSLSYKGFQNGVPDPLISNSRCELMSSINASNLRIASGGKIITSATKEVKYLSPQSNYRYIRSGEPSTPKYSDVRGAAAVKVQNTRISVSYDDGTTGVFIGTAPAALATALFLEPQPFITGPSSTQVFGTPYWECEESIVLRYPEN